VHASAMAECAQEAILIITMTPTGTATNVARRRIELRCGLEAGHEGPHRDLGQGEEWEAGGPPKPMLLRHEDEVR
jgi:hypothetical protein